jgi:PII-like signaling protein
MSLVGPALRLTVVVGESDHVHGKPLYTEIVHRAHAAGMAGATVLRGIEGYGRSNHIHTTRILSLSEDLPVCVVVVDTEEKVRAFVDQLDGLVTEGVIVVDQVEVVKYAGRDGGAPGAAG